MTMLVLYLSMLADENDKQGFNQIYHKYHDDILRRVYNILRNEEDTKDAMQETWIRVLKSMEVLHGKEDAVVRTYIMTIARNQSISILRKKKKEKELFESADALERVSDTDLFEACESEGIARVKACIDMLGDAQRDVIILYYLYDHSLKEIAKLLDISEVVAESRWNHGRVRLINLLKRRGVYAGGENEGK
jgi:RNA polymerase sigma-70 factor (ECF subfamily)